MRCMVCEDLSFKHICKTCQNELLSPSFYKRKLLGKIPVYSFYKYQDIESLLLTKHTDLGYYIYTILAQNSFSAFAQGFKYENKVCSLSVDDHTKSGYSHTAILNKQLESSCIKPRYAKLRALSSTSYSGKDYQFRLLNPRNFQMKTFEEEDVIIVDDIITTGLTLTQAVQEVQNQGKNVLFCLTLADARK
ncbi:ComF family protein [Sulfurimonas sp. MAG313]|nr:phosphoribosyltransferase family protein [Sulfurimonas sp. MAG313]MDF1879699.1 ComF family protein [Sulfurimonas sp. MAG313]